MAGVSELSQARVSAAMVRATWLARLAAGRVDVTEVVEAAARLENRPLRSMRVRRLLACAPGWGEHRAAGAHRMLRLLWRERSRRTNTSAPIPGEVTIGNLLDARGERSVIWALAVHRPSTPWEGFPFTAGGKDGHAAR